MMFMRSGMGTPMPEWTTIHASPPPVKASASEYSLGPIVLPTMVPPKTTSQLAPFSNRASSVMRRTGVFRGLRDTADPGISNGLMIIGVLGVLGLGLWAFSGKKHHRRR